MFARTFFFFFFKKKKHGYRAISFFFFFFSETFLGDVAWAWAWALAWAKWFPSFSWWGAGPPRRTTTTTTRPTCPGKGGGQPFLQNARIQTYADQNPSRAGGSAERTEYVRLNLCRTTVSLPPKTMSLTHSAFPAILSAITGLPACPILSVWPLAYVCLPAYPCVHPLRPTQNHQDYSPSVLDNSWT